MKKLVRTMLMLSVASLAILTSCNQEDDDKVIKDVEITISASPATSVTAGNPVTLTLALKGNSDNKLKKVTVTSSASTTALLSKTLSGADAVETVVDTPETVGNITYTVTLEGEKGNPQTKTYTINVLPVPGPVAVTSTPIDLFGHVNGDGGSSRFMATTDPFTQVSLDNFNSNKGIIDIAYYRGATNGNTLASPSNTTMQGLYSGLTWTGVKTTKVAKTTMTVAQFDAYAANPVNDSLIWATASSSTWIADGAANQLAVGNVVLFETAAGKKGLIKVANLAGANTAGDPAQMTLSIIVQQ
ncbi:MAG: hypothetical protein MUE96_07235 [Bacteroidia bacterium]|jgi:hypothetical protein|nr:hypothetical protein [Bacteroidia bacterium]